MSRSRNRLDRRRRRGFTLMEVLLVVAILVILASLATLSIRQAYISARTNAAKLNIDTINQAVNSYYLSVGHLPNDLTDLIQDNQGSGKWEGPYIANGAVPVDPWGNEFQYVVVDPATEQFRISSNGPDSMQDSGDDISYLSTK